MTMLLEKANRLLAENKLKEAEFHFKMLLEAEPENGEALFGLGRIALRLKRFDAAVYLLQLACERLPYMLEPLHALADAFEGVGSRQDALTVLEYAKSIATHNPEPHYFLGQHYLTYGQLDKAQATFTHALTMGNHPVTAYILYELVQLGNFNNEHNYLSRLHQMLTLTQNHRLKMVCYYALAKSYDKLGDTEQAFNYYKLANEFQHKLSTFRTQELTPFYNKIIEHNHKECLEQADKKFTSTVTPVFIIGMPRSGSTLVEQLLLSHPDFSSIGEDDCISNEVVAYIEQQTQHLYPECMAYLDAGLVNRARNLYIKALERNTKLKPFMINKLPANYQSVGLIYILFPNAKFIDVRRDFNATAWSVFSNYFAENEPYFCNLSEFKHYYDLYTQIMAHWQAHIQSNLHPLDYESLVTEPQGTINKLCEFLQIKNLIDQSNFYRSEHPVTTLSKAAVRAPINTNALEKWKRFEAPMLALLNETPTTPVNP